MRETIFLVILMFSTLILQAQVFEVAQGDDLSKAVPKESQYIFDEFVDGRVQFKNGTFTVGKMNYNVLLGVMQFMDTGTNDVLSLSNIDQINSVTIKGRRFIPAKVKEEFMEVMISGPISFGVRYKGDAISISKEGAYGSVSTAVGGTTSYSVYSPGDNVLNQNLAIKEQIAVKLFSFCYLIKDGKPVAIKGAKTFLNTYPKDKTAAINSFVNEHKLNFNSLDGLIELVRYANGL